MLNARFLEESEWKYFHEKVSPDTFLQSNFWSSFRSKVGWTTWRIGVFDGDFLKAGSVVMRFSPSNEINFLYIPEGPFLPFDDSECAKLWNVFFEFVKKELVNSGTSHLRIEPRIPTVPDIFSKFQKSTYSFEPRDTIVMDLTQSEEQLLESMHPKGRYNIKLAQKHGVKVHHGLNEANLKDFMDIYFDTAERKHFASKHKSYFATLLPILQQEKCGEIFIAEYENKPVAVALVIFCGKRATYFFGGSLPSYSKFMAPYLLHWEIMKFAKNAGYTAYDFWGIAPDSPSKNNPWLGITAFKRKFGGEAVHLMPTLDYVFDQGNYEQALLLAKS